MGKIFLLHLLSYLSAIYSYKYEGKDIMTVYAAYPTLEPEEERLESARELIQDCFEGEDAHD